MLHRESMLWTFCTPARNSDPEDALVSSTDEQFGVAVVDDYTRADEVGSVDTGCYADSRL